MQEDTTSRGAAKQAGHLFCFGLGYTTLGLANTLKRQGWQVTGTCRSEEKKEALSTRGFQAVVFDTDGEIEGLESDGLAALRSATHIVASIPPVADFDQDPALALHVAQIRAAASQRLEWIGYLSTTGVYGDWDGDWVDESTEPRPSNARTAARLRAEAAWWSLGKEMGVPVHIFRLGGIYGPSRSALDAVNSGRPASQTQRVRESRRFTSRCHVADIVQVVASAMKHPTAGGRIYNVVDDNPAPRQEVMAYARQLLKKRKEAITANERTAEREGDGTSRRSQAGIEGTVNERRDPEAGLSPGVQGRLEDGNKSTFSRPGLSSDVRGAESGHPSGEEERLRALQTVDTCTQTDTRQMSATAEVVTEDSKMSRGSSRGVDEKRVRNERIKQELGIKLLFPSYKEGLLAVARGEMRPFDENNGP